MRLLLESLSWGASLIVLLPALVLLAEALAAGWPGGERTEPPIVEHPRLAVVVPAHNEAGQIEETVRTLLVQLTPGARLIVVADNCTDDTAARAAGAGATVIERRDPVNVGKGFAISFALQHLDADPPEVVVLVDADCRVSPGGLAVIAAAAAREQRPIQAEYLLSAPTAVGPMTVISALAILLRNRVRPRGLRRLGLPCHLTGSGMAFPWRLIREAPEMHSNLVEDLAMGIALALQGKPARLCPSVQITSELPEDRAAGLKQRRRWEHGQLHTLTTVGPRLLGAGLVRRRADLIALGMDLMVPPLALLVMMQVSTLALTAALAASGRTSALPAVAAAAAFGALGVSVAIAWIGFGRKTLPLRYVLYVPVYLLWKAPLYVALAIGGKQKTWERTARKGPPDASAAP